MPCQTNFIQVVRIDRVFSRCLHRAKSIVRTGYGSYALSKFSDRHSISVLCTRIVHPPARKGVALEPRASATRQFALRSASSGSGFLTSIKVDLSTRAHAQIAAPIIMNTVATMKQKRSNPLGVELSLTNRHTMSSRSTAAFIASNSPNYPCPWSMPSMPSRLVWDTHFFWRSFAAPPSCCAKKNNRAGRKQDGFSLHLIPPWLPAPARRPRVENVNRPSLVARFRGSSFELIYSRPGGPMAVTCVMYSPDDPVGVESGLRFLTPRLGAVLQPPLRLV